MDMREWLNDTYMPNATKSIYDPNNLDVLLNSTAPNGGIYGLPYYSPSQVASGCYGTSERLYFRQSWLDAVGMENPTTEEELLAKVEQFKEEGCTLFK